MTIIGSNDAEFGLLLKFLTTYYCQRDLTLKVFWKYLRVKNEYFGKFRPWHTFSRLSVTKMMARKCDHFGENLLKIWLNGVRDIQRFFLFLQMTNFPPGKVLLETQLYGNIHSCCTLFKDLEYLVHNPQQISN